MPWKGRYVAEVSFNDPTPGERLAANGTEKYDAVSYATTVTYVSLDGAKPIAPPPPAKPAAPSK